DAYMTETMDERDQLIADLLEEAHGLRMKYEEFSQYTESKVAEFVIARKELTQERDSAVHHLSLAQRDLQVLRQRQDQLQAQMIQINSRIDKLTKQRDRARERVAALEASRAFRIATRLRKMFGN
ncbi:MAG: hypothetical protein ACO3KE_03295, partial [Ilumatobacteraceae bacterium]